MHRRSHTKGAAGPATAIVLASNLLFASSTVAANDCASQRLAASDAAAGDQFGAAAAMDGDTLIVGALLDSGPAGSAQGSAYVYRWSGDGWIEEAKLTASDAAAFDFFGEAVALSGDTALVGSFEHDGAAGSNQGAAYVFVRNGTTWTQQAKLTASDAAANDFFGAAVALDGDTALIGASGDDGPAGSNQGAAYVFVRNGATWTQQAKLTASDAAADDQFGRSVALDGDAALVGAQLDDGGAQVNQGAAYIYRRSGAGWIEEAKLTASDAAANDQFGRAVALDGDTALIGASGDDGPAGSNQGAAYVFVRSGSTWTQQAKLAASDAAAEDQFAAAVALEGDTLIVGASSDDAAAGSDQGSAYVFVGSGASWTQQAKLTAGDAEGGDRFGSAIALDGDTALVGAAGDDGGAGSAHVFTQVGPFWIGPDQKVLASDAAAGDQFGLAVALDGDTALIGAFGDDGAAGSNQGAAYVFVRSGPTWMQHAKLTASDAAASDQFGRSVALDGDTALVGAPGDDGAAGSDQGSAYVFVRDGPTWTQQAKLTASDAALGDRFGNSVALDGATALIGADDDDGPAGMEQGSAYVFTGAGSTWTQQAKLTASDAAASDNFGTSVALDGDTALVGAVLDDGAAGMEQGSAYVFVRNGSTWTEQAKLNASDAAEFDRFGASAALDGDTALVGARSDDGAAGFDQGSAYVFTRSGTSWTEQARLTASDAAASDNFGTSVALDGDTALIGAPLDNGTVGLDEGSAYVFARRGSTWAQLTKLTASDAAPNDFFGFSVALDGDTALVGAQLDDDPAGSDQGSAWFVTVAEECLPLVHNVTQSTVHASLPEGIAQATAFDELVATPPTLQAEPLVDTGATPVFIEMTGGVRQPYTDALILGGSSLLATPSDLAADFFGDVTLAPGAALLTGDRLRFTSDLALNGGRLSAQRIVNRGSITGFGDIEADTANDGDVTIAANTQHIGDYTNNGTTTIQNGTLTILGALTNNGTIIGDFASTESTESAGGGLFAEADLSIGTNATLRMTGSSAFVRAGGGYDVSIDDNTAYDMAAAELRMVGVAGPQSLEAMSLDIGNDPAGLDRTVAGHYPIGTLRIGPTPTTVNLVDAHDNDSQDQTAPEAIYVSNLIIDAGATLNTNGIKIYYETLMLDGAVDAPSCLVELAAPCPADLNASGAVDGADLGLLLLGWGPCP